MNVVLAGNPNAGKTTLFNALTKSRLKTGNWHGVTTSAAKKTVNGDQYIDVPGMYSFSTYSMEEKSAATEIFNADIIVNVIDALTLESSLALTLNLLSLKKPTVIYLTKIKALKKRGGWVNTQKLSLYLGVTVVKDIKSLKTVLAQKNACIITERKDALRLNEAYYGGNLQVSRAEKLFYNRYFALAFFIFSIVLMFFLAFYPSMPGAILKDLLEVLICEKLGGALGSVIKNDLIKSLVCEGIIGGAGGVLSFIPQLAILYLFLTFLDESGVMSALAFVTDGLFEKVNLSGRAAFSLISGFGCTAAAILTTRGFTEKSTQRRTVAVLAYVPCGAKLPVFLTFLSPIFKNPFPAVCVLYFLGLALAILGAKLLKGGSENLLTEVTPIGVPQLKQTQIKLFFYLKGFIIKVVSAVMVFCVISWFASHFSFTFKPVDIDESILATLSRLICPLFYPMGITDWRIAYAIISGFAAKENIAATINLLMPNGMGISVASAVALSVFTLLSPACVSAFAASVKEVGWRYTLKYYSVQIILSFLISYAVYFVAHLF